MALAFVQQPFQLLNAADYYYWRLLDQFVVREMPIQNARPTRTASDNE